MKVLIYGDLQVTHASPEYAGTLAKTLDFLVSVVRDLKPDLVVNLGDTYDTNGLIDVRDLLLVTQAMDAVNAAMARLAEAAGPKRHIILLGNHDIGPGGRSAIEVLGDASEVVMAPTVLTRYGLPIPVLPYTRDLEAARAVLASVAAVPVPFCVGHIEWLGAQMTPTTVSKIGFSIDEYRAIFPRQAPPFFNGHYHAPANLNPLYLVGSPLYRDFSDEASENALPRGFMFFDSDSGAVQQVPNPFTYQVRTVHVETEEDLARLSAMNAADRTKVRVFAPRRLIGAVEEMRGEFLWLSALPSDAGGAASVQHKVSVSPSTAAQDIVTAAVAAAPPDLDRARLQEIGERLFA